MEQSERHHFEMSQDPERGREGKLSADGAKHTADRAAQILVPALLLTNCGCEIRQTASFLRSSLRSQLVNEIWRGIQRNQVRTGPFERP